MTQNVDSITSGVVDFDGKGRFNVTPFSLTSLNSSSAYQNSSPCPDTHFLCPKYEWHCLPVYVRCNGVYDCPGREDEATCESYTCPGHYRCRASYVCLHPGKYLCDGIVQCPQHDDELFCHNPCPDKCTCYGNAFVCRRKFPVHQYSNLRFLDARSSGLTPAVLTNNRLLVYLSLALCDLRYLDLPVLRNLQSLDLSNNHLSTVTTQQLSRVNRLRSLSLAGNPLVLYTLKGWFPLLDVFDLSRVNLIQFNISILAAFPNLRTLNLSHSGVEILHGGEGFGNLEKLNVLDLRGCPMTSFPRDMLRGLQNLETVYADNYKLCCAQVLPRDFVPSHCLSPSDEITSCDALLRSDFYRVLLTVSATLALLGNLASFVFRARHTGSGFGVLVTHLCVSDFVMGVYLTVIGVADRLYLGNYLWKEAEWRNSVVCQAAGFMSVLSSEVSAFVVCLITLERFLVLRFPFSTIRFSHRSAHAACCVTWALGSALASLPLLPPTSHWRFYSQTGICLQLPVTKSKFSGRHYSFGVMIVLNFALFLLIFTGQLVIYWSIKANRISSDVTSKKAKDLTIARRLFSVVMSDFLCWFPITILGLLASSGAPIPGEVNVAMAIVVLPINSALNPFLYTLNLILERRRLAREQRLMKFYMAQAKNLC